MLVREHEGAGVKKTRNGERTLNRVRVLGQVIVLVSKFALLFLLNTKGMTMTTSKILGRAWFYDDEPTELELWEHEFEPMTNGRRSGAEWCREHLLECVGDDLREILGVPKEGSFQVLFKGTMSGWKTRSMDGDDWDEEFELEETKIEPIPQEYMNFINERFISCPSCRGSGTTVNVSAEHGDVIDEEICGVCNGQGKTRVR